MTEELKIVFAPGAFADFEGTQEELDAFVAEVTSLFEGKTAEELHDMGRSIDIDELYEEDPELAEKLANSILKENDTRKLQ